MYDGSMFFKLISEFLFCHLVRKIADMNFSFVWIPHSFTTNSSSQIKRSLRVRHEFSSYTAFLVPVYPVLNEILSVQASTITSVSGFQKHNMQWSEMVGYIFYVTPYEMYHITSTLSHVFLISIACSSILPSVFPVFPVFSLYSQCFPCIPCVFPVFPVFSLYS